MMFKSKQDYRATLVSQFLVAIAGTCYYFADNFDSIISEFSNELGCNSNCVDVINHVTNTLLVVSLLIFTLVPTVIERMKIIDDIRVYHAEKWHWAIIKDTGHALALIVDLDAWFSTIADIPFYSADYCPNHVLILAWVMYGFCLFVWLLLLILIYTPGVQLALNETPQKFKKVTIYVCLMILLWTMTAITLLADNEQPIGCLFNCDMSDYRAVNYTDCQATNYHGSRAILLGAVVIVFGVMVVFISAMRIGTRIAYYNKVNNSLIKRKQ